MIDLNKRYGATTSYLKEEDERPLIFERVGDTVYARYFGDKPETRWVYKKG